MTKWLGWEWQATHDLEIMGGLNLGCVENFYLVVREPNNYISQVKVEIIQIASSSTPPFHTIRNV